MLSNYSLLYPRKIGEYALLWSAAKKKDRISYKEAIEVDIIKSCDQIITATGEPSERLPLHLAANLMYGACILHNIQCSECVCYYEKKINFLTLLNIEDPNAMQNFLPLREAKDAAQIKGKRRMIETDETNVTSDIEEQEPMELINVTPDIKRSPSPSVSLPQETMNQPSDIQQSPLVTLQNISNMSMEPLRDHLFAASIPHGDLKVFEEIEECAEQLKFLDEYEIPLVPAEKPDGQITTDHHKLLELFSESSSSDAQKKQSEQPTGNIAHSSEESASPEVAQRRHAIYNVDTDIEMRIKKELDYKQTRCKNFADDMITIRDGTCPHLLINGWNLDRFPQRAISFHTTVSRRKLEEGSSVEVTPNIMRVPVIQHSEERYKSTPEASVLQTDIGRKESSVTPVKLPSLTEYEVEIPMETAAAIPMEIDEPVDAFEIPMESRHPEDAAEIQMEISQPMGALKDFEQTRVDENESVERRTFDKQIALEELKQRILKLWEDLDEVTFENLCPRGTTNKIDIIRTLQLLSILDFNEFLYLNQASPQDQIIISKFEPSTVSGSNESS